MILEFLQRAKYIWECRGGGTWRHPHMPHPDFWSFMEQLFRRGWSDIDMWALDDAMGPIMARRLERFLVVSGNSDDDVEDIKKVADILGRPKDHYRSAAAEAHWVWAWKRLGELMPSLWT